MFAATMLALAAFAGPASATITPTSPVLDPVGNLANLTVQNPLNAAGGGVTNVQDFATNVSQCAPGATTAPCTWSITGGQNPSEIGASPCNKIATTDSSGDTAAWTCTPDQGAITLTNFLVQVFDKNSTLVDSRRFTVNVVVNFTNSGSGSFGGSAVNPANVVADDTLAKQGVYVASWGSNRVNVIDGSTNSPTVRQGEQSIGGCKIPLTYLNFDNTCTTLPPATLNSPQGVTVVGRSSGSWLWTTNFLSSPGTASKIHLNTQSPGTAAALRSLVNSSGPGSLPCTYPDGVSGDNSTSTAGSAFIWIACGGTGVVKVLDADATNSANPVVADIRLPACGTHHAGPSGVAPTNIANVVLVADARCDKVYAINSAAHNVGSASLPAGSFAANETYGAKNVAGTHGTDFVALPGNDEVAQFDTSGTASSVTITQENLIPAGVRPYDVTSSQTPSNGIATIGVSNAGDATGTTSCVGPATVDIYTVHTASPSNPVNPKFTVSLPSNECPDGIASSDAQQDSTHPGGLFYVGAEFNSEVFVVDPPRGRARNVFRAALSAKTLRAAKRATALAVAHNQLLHPYVSNALPTWSTGG